GRARGPVVVLFLSLQVIAPVFWLPALPGYGRRVREFVAFASNASLLRGWSYAWDRLHGRYPETPTLAGYALFMLFFPAFPNGPFLSLDKFDRARLAGHWDAAAPAPAIDWRAIGRFLTGLGALGLAIPLAPLLDGTGYEKAASGGTLWAWTHAAGVYLAVYLGVTAWAGAAIGVGRVGGHGAARELPGPHRASRRGGLRR